MSLVICIVKNETCGSSVHAVTVSEREVNRVNSVFWIFSSSMKQ